MTLLVKRKGYIRRGYVRKDGVRVKRTRVPATTFKIKDRGAKGRGKKVLPKLKKGSLGFSLKGKTQAQINRLALKKARALGERRVAGKLRALQVLNKRTNPTISRKAAKAAKYVYQHIGKYKGK